MRNQLDRHLTLQQLEKSVWPKPDFDSYLVRRCNELRKIPLDQLTTEDLRILIGQQIGLEFLVDIAIEKLTDDILAEGDLYPGDLLKSLTDIDKKYWADHNDQFKAMADLVRQNLEILQDTDINTRMFYKP